MKVGLIRVDGKMPNLALMKLSSWHKKQKLLEFGVKPFVMIYNNKADAKLHRLARWINRGYHRLVSWEDYKT